MAASKRRSTLSTAPAGAWRLFGDAFALRCCSKHPAHIRGGIDYHSFGQIFLRPYAWASTATNPPANDEEVARLGQAMADAAAATPDGVP